MGKKDLYYNIDKKKWCSWDGDVNIYAPVWYKSPLDWFNTMLNELDDEFESLDDESESNEDNIHDKIEKTRKLFNL